MINKYAFFIKKFIELCFFYEKLFDIQFKAIYPFFLQIILNITLCRKIMQ